MSSIFFNPRELASIVHSNKNQGKKVVLTSGIFDLIHVGHVSKLKRAREYGDLLIVQIKPDQQIANIKSSVRPIIPAEQRAEMLVALKMVDYVIISEHSMKLGELLDIIKPDVYVKTKRPQYTDEYIKERIALYKKRSPDTEIIFLEETHPLHTTDIINKILQTKNDSN